MNESYFELKTFAILLCRLNILGHNSVRNSTYIHEEFKSGLNTGKALESFVLPSPADTNTPRLKYTKLQFHALSCVGKKSGLSPQGKITDWVVC
jgi:hypothetical protein